MKYTGRTIVGNQQSVIIFIPKNVAYFLAKIAVKTESGILQKSNWVLLIPFDTKRKSIRYRKQLETDFVQLYMTVNYPQVIGKVFIPISSNFTAITILFHIIIFICTLQVIV